jgi:hypothetical protein
MNDKHILLGNAFSTQRTRVNQRNQRNLRRLLASTVSLGVIGSLVVYYW